MKQIRLNEANEFLIAQLLRESPPPVPTVSKMANFCIMLGAEIARNRMGTKKRKPQPK